MRPFILKIFLSVLISLFIAVPVHAQEKPPAKQSTGILRTILDDIEFTSRLKTEYDDNIFLSENNENSDIREVFTQHLRYNKSFDQHFWKLEYTGNHSYYIEESTNVLDHTADFLYSYRPFTNLSLGLGNTFYWLQDSRITAALGDRLLALGYIQNTPSFEIKYEAHPRLTLSSHLAQQMLNVRNDQNDDFIDHKRTTAINKLSYQLTEDQNMSGFLGYDYDTITFPHIEEKAATSHRGLLGLTKKFSGIGNVTAEAGYKYTDIDETNVDDENVDYRLSMESNFSLFTKLTVFYNYNVKNPSLRREYSQYASNLGSITLTHTMDPKTSCQLGYSHERQDFNSSNVLSGQSPVDRQTYIQTFNTGLNRKLNNWLTLEVTYDYTKRDTDFVSEGYTDNKYGIALTARY